MSVESPSVDGGQPCFADPARRTDHRAPPAGRAPAPRGPPPPPEGERRRPHGPAHPETRAGDDDRSGAPRLPNPLVRTGSPRSPAAAEVPGDGPEGPVDEDPHRALRPAEDTGDLGRRHLLDETQDDRPAAIGGQSTNGLPRPGCLLTHRRPALD